MDGAMFSDEEYATIGHVANIFLDMKPHSNMMETEHRKLVEEILTEDRDFLMGGLYRILGILWRI